MKQTQTVRTTRKSELTCVQKQTVRTSRKSELLEVKERECPLQSLLGYSRQSCSLQSCHQHLQFMPAGEISDHVQTRRSYPEPKLRVLHDMKRQTVRTSRKSEIQKVKISFSVTFIPEMNPSTYMINEINIYMIYLKNDLFI